MNTDPFKLDLLTQQFIVHRWRTTQGREVRDKILHCLHEGKNVTEVLNPYVLQHPANAESYEYPYYPPDAMNTNDFWVLANDDLRGIQFYEEDFVGSNALSKLNFSYAIFSKCNFNKVTLELIDLSHAIIEACNCSDAVFSQARCVATKFMDTTLNRSILLDSYFVCTVFSNTDLRAVYFENTKLQKIRLDYQTKLDKKLRTYWHERSLPKKQLPDLYRSIRMAYDDAELYTQSDYYLMCEFVAYRKYHLWPEMFKLFNLHRCRLWVTSYIWSMIAGYGTRPLRTIFIGFLISLFYSVIYFLIGVPGSFSNQHPLLTAIYLSFTTYSTLGYGDITYMRHQPWMRILTTSEAWVGAVMIALFVVILARKLIRR